MSLVRAAFPTARRDEGRFIAARGLSIQALATPDPWSLYFGGKRWGDSAWLDFFLVFFCCFYFHTSALRANYQDFQRRDQRSR